MADYRYDSLEGLRYFEARHQTANNLAVRQVSWLTLSASASSHLDVTLGIRQKMSTRGYFPGGGVGGAGTVSREVKLTRLTWPPRAWTFCTRSTTWPSWVQRARTLKV